MCFLVTHFLFIYIFLFTIQQPFSVYHLSQPHFIKVKNDHLGASPFIRASASKSMQLLRKVLQPAINHDIVKVFEKYILVNISCIVS